MAARFAADTAVSTEASRMEIERTLRRYGADAFVFAEDRGVVTIMFRIEARMIRFKTALPARDDPDFAFVNKGAIGRQPRSPASIDKVWDQACRQTWRALLLIIKAKLEAIAAGVTSIEDEFLAQTMMADGQTVGEIVRPQVEAHIRLGGSTQLRLEGPR